MSYFFNPYIGPNYKDGFTFDDAGQLITKENNPQNLKLYKVMVLGCSHYCKDKKFCGIHTWKNNAEILDCAKDPTCKELTKNVVKNFIEGTSYKSFSKFTNVFREGKENRKMVWENFLFSNFFQRGMPFTKDKLNEPYMNSEEGTEAFLDIVKQNSPDIIIIWGDKPQDAIYKNISKVTKDFSLRIENRPKIKVNNEKYPISFNIMDGIDNNGHKKSYLLIEGYHPASTARYFNKDRFKRCLVFAFNNYNTLIKAPKNLYEPTFTCIIENSDNKDTWENKKTFDAQLPNTPQV